MSQPSRYVTVCRGRCTQDCEHGQQRESPLSWDSTYVEHPQMHYPPCDGYTAEQALRGESVVCGSCVLVLDGHTNGDWDEERAVIKAWRGLIRVQTYIWGSSTPDPKLARDYAHWPCGWKSQYENDGKPFLIDKPDEPVPAEVHCPRCDVTLPTIVNTGNYIEPPDLLAKLADRRRIAAEKEASRVAAR